MSVSAPSPNTNEPREIETLEIEIPFVAVVLGAIIATATLTMVHCFEHFGPECHQFKRTFYLFYMTYLLALVTNFCEDAVPVKKMNKSVQVQGRRPAPRASGL